MKELEERYDPRVMKRAIPLPDYLPGVYFMGLYEIVDLITGETKQFIDDTIYYRQLGKDKPSFRYSCTSYKSGDYDFS